MANIICQKCGNPDERKRSDAVYCNNCLVLARRDRQSKYESHKTEFCPLCDNQMVRRSLICKPCNNELQTWRIRGELNGGWKGGKTRDRYGYVYTRTGRVGGQSAYTADHRLVWEAENGPIPDGYIIHHRNGVKDDNRLENLEAMPRSEHHKHDREAELRDRIVELESQLARLSS